MKNFILILKILSIGFLWFLWLIKENATYAFECQPWYVMRVDESWCDPVNESKPTTVYTTEMIPGAQCECYAENKPWDGNGPTQILKWREACNVSVEKRKYVCTVQPWLAGFQQILASIIRWFVYIVMLLGVLGIVWLGIAWSFSGGDDAKAKSKLKWWAINILIWLTILFLFRYILIFIAPWVYN